MPERFTTRDIEAELMIHDGETDAVHVLSRIARLVYESSLAGQSVDQIVQALSDSFAIPEDRDVARDVSRCIEELRAKGLLS